MKVLQVRRLSLFTLMFISLIACSTSSPETTVPSIPETGTIAAVTSIDTLQVPSSTITPTEVRPTPTDLPSFTWNSNVDIVAELPLNRTQWSPTRPELVGSNCLLDTAEGQLYLAQAPAFSLVDLINKESGCDIDMISGVPTIWTKNGDYIVWSGVGPIEEFMTNDVMIINREGDQFRSLDNGWRNTKFAGWADSITLFVSYYGGGGTREGFFVNIVTGEKLHFPRRYPHFYSPNLFYLPVQEFSYPNAASVTDPLVMRSSLENGEFSSYPPNGFSQGIVYAPQLDAAEDRTGVFFIDWSPDNEKALVLITQNSLRINDDTFKANLALWEPRSETMSLLIEGGLSGEFSKDGNLLAVSSKYPFILDENRFVKGIDKSSARGNYLSILEIKTQRVIYTSATKSYTATGPDLVFEWTGGELVNFDWHPDSQHFVHRSTNGHLTIVNLSTGIEKALTEGYGERVRDPEWSYDGEYLKLLYWEKDEAGSVYYPYRLPRTTIINIQD